MPEIVKTMKLRLHTDEDTNKLFSDVTVRFAEACNFISDYVFNHGFVLNYITLQQQWYQTIRSQYGLKSQMAISAFKTVTARYKAVKEQLFKVRFDMKTKMKTSITLLARWNGYGNPSISNDRKRI